MVRFLADPLRRAYTTTYVEGYRLLGAWLDARPPTQPLSHRSLATLLHPRHPHLRAGHVGPAVRPVGTASIRRARSGAATCGHRGTGRQAASLGTRLVRPGSAAAAGRPAADARSAGRAGTDR